MTSQNTHVPHLENVEGEQRKKIQSVSQSARLTAEQPAVVAPELSKETEQPIPYVEQAAATGPEMVGAEDPQNDTPRIKKTLFEKIVSVFKK